MGGGGGGLHVNLFSVFCCAAQDDGGGLQVYLSHFYGRGFSHVPFLFRGKKCDLGCNI